MENFSAVLTYAVRDYEWLPDNPMHKIRKPQDHAARTRFLSQEERARLLPACQRSHTPALYPVVMLALTTGARKMEILTLRWQNIDLDQGVMRLERTKNGERRASPPPGRRGAPPVAARTTL